ncbi:hypothetical protein NSK_003192 [Nannochloropsis salina CCMP1776]|uniref:Protein kinase domain-containing protein n=1 Tax=Nannochloropsis salina CCMP1776 TaxID=1027361 RepID=A0A4D9D3U1_9STRA|nr:hypothetical protein NSK_003192 [Nannochloropsis salina CCMP1776]|eukprot:TFJ85684.1 hypothetical protein NSK_003192 [Nannochloropsis salina CCMP1776]
MHRLLRSPAADRASSTGTTQLSNLDTFKSLAYPPICGNLSSEVSGGSYVVVEACVKTGAVVLVLLYMYHRRRSVESPSSSSTLSALNWSAGQGGASTSLIFPFYYSLFYATACVDVLTVALSLTFGGHLPPAIAALCWALNRLITEGLTIFLLHHGVGLATLQYSFTYAVMWALVSFLAWYCVPLLRADGNANVVGDVLALLYLTPPLIGYLLLSFAPMKVLPRRPAVLPVALFMSAVFAALVLREALLAAHSFLPGPCLLWSAWSLLLWACFPWVVYHALVADTRWWQGLYQNPRGWAGNLNTPLLDVWSDGLLDVPASELATLMHQLETEPGAGLPAPVHNPSSPASSPSPRPSPPADAGPALVASGRVPIVPFGQLRLRTDLRYRSGSNSRVYVGEWNGRRVAVKMLFSMELDRAILQAFVQEARLLYGLRRHPNILRCLGVAIMPPAACLVTEFCEHGSLFDFLRRFRQQELRRERQRRCRGQAQRRPQVLTKTGRNGEAEAPVNDCAKGEIAKEEEGEEEEKEEVEDGGEEEEEEGADTELLLEKAQRARTRSSLEPNGLEPPLPSQLPLSRRLELMVECAAGVRHLHARGLVHGDIKSLNFLVDRALAVKLGDVGECRQAGCVPEGGLPIFPSTINWAPPEVLAGSARRYHPSMDVYSLGLVLHELMTLEAPFHHEPFTRRRSQDLVQHIIQGGRPSFHRGRLANADGDGGNGEDNRLSLPVPPSLQKLLHQCWRADPAQRPSASQVHDHLVELLRGTEEVKGV